MVPSKGNGMLVFVKTIHIAHKTINNEEDCSDRLALKDTCRWDYMKSSLVNKDLQGRYQSTFNAHITL